MEAAHFLVGGKVQGVGFRAGTLNEAARLGIVACRALNLSDGRVEVAVKGETVAIAALAEWLRHGPSGARVDAVAWEELDAGSVPDGLYAG